MNEHLRSFDVSNVKAPIKIAMAGITYPDPNYYISRKSSECFVIEYVTAGEGQVLLDGKLSRVSGDSVYILFRNERHEYFADKKEPFTKIFLNVTGSMCDQLLLEYGISKRVFVGVSEIKPLFERIIEIIDSGTAECEMQAALQGILTEILSRLSSLLVMDKHSEEALELKNYLDRSLTKQVSAAELAGSIFRSKDYCQKLFYREFGITPYAYCLERKMQMAKALLTNTQSSIGEIAESLGYSDIHYFSNLFLKKCGERPLSYRKSKR